MAVLRTSTGRSRAAVFSPHDRDVVLLTGSATGAAGWWTVAGGAIPGPATSFRESGRGTRVNLSVLDRTVPELITAVERTS
jgi:hypothetical protein